MEIFGIIAVSVLILLPLAAVFISHIAESISRPHEAKVKLEKEAKEKQIARYKHLADELEKKIQSAIPDYAVAKQELKNIATREIREKFFLPVKRILDSEYDLDEMYLSVANGKLNDVFSPYGDKLKLSHYEISALIQGAGLYSTPSHTFYHTTLRSCDCEDFVTTKKPCKHILYLAYTLGVLQTNQENCKKHRDVVLERMIANAKERDRLSFVIETENQKIDGLLRKAKEVRCEISSLEKAQEAEEKLKRIQEMFPNITDIFDDGFNDQDFTPETAVETDQVRTYLSPEEYATLSTTQKNQLALDRYLDGRKSRWQVGRDYEMYIGYLYESEGYTVQYTGIIENFEDMGRDLIAKRGNEVLIIQCKNWSKEKSIHEKHIFQLFGSVVEYNIKNIKHANGVFVSTTDLSPVAETVAKELGITIRYIPLGEFPRIKCNINRTTGEQIYHLPFDQLYDQTVVEKSRGECYAFTVAEAESLGFRRAKRHVPD